MVVPVFDNPQWETDQDTPSRPHNLYRCIPAWLGGSKPGSPHRGSVDSSGAEFAHQLSGTPGGVECSASTLPGKGEHNCADMAGQFQCSGLYQPHGWHKIFNAGFDCHQILDVGIAEEHHTSSSSYSRSGQLDSRHNVQTNCKGLDRLETESNNFLTDCGALGPLPRGHVCNPTVNPSPPVLLLEARNNGGGHRCISTGLVTDSRVCQPPLVSHSTMPEKGHHAENYNSDSDTTVDNSELVSNDNAPMHRPPLTITSDTRSNAPHSQCRNSITQSSSSTGHLAYFRQSLTHQRISTEARELIISSWRDSSNKNYNSAWRKWELWCNQKCINPISTSIESILSLLALQFHVGHQYRSLNIYRSAISSVHPKVDGFDVGKHLLVSRLMKDKRPPLPGYTMTWSVGIVLDYLRSLGHNSELDLSHKTATLLALCTTGRSSDLSVIYKPLCLNYRGS